MNGIFAWRNDGVDRPRISGPRKTLWIVAALLAWTLLLVVSWPVQAQAVPGVVPAAASSEPARPVPRWLVVPRARGRLTAAQLGVVINTADPYSVEVGEYYVKQRDIPASHVLRVDLPVQPRLDEADLARLKQAIEARFDDSVQALALAWTQPYAVACQSINAVLALGLDPQLCSRSCDRASTSPYFNSASREPWKDHGLRPSMLIAARSTAQAKALIDRGIASDHTLGLRGSPPVQAWYLRTSDAARSVRWPLFPPAGPVPQKALDIQVERQDGVPQGRRVVLMQTGQALLKGLERIDWVPGALADHLTSFGGLLERTDGQTTALAWLEAGATASYGTVSEPCNHPQKFPHPQLLLLHYVQGSTALEAYWKSVAWPQQGVFVGEPLAAPFAIAPQPVTASTHGVR